MAVPKKRTGHSAQGHRRSNWKATRPTTTKCPNCGATVLTHTVCTECGTYKGQPVRLKDKAAAPKAAVEAPKKSAKKEKIEKVEKVEKVEEVKEVKTEEVKVEEPKAEEVKAEEASETEEK